MIRISRVWATLLVATFLAASAAPNAFAISVELAKKCREMAIKAHPPVRAGTSKGTAQAERDFFDNCVAKEGKIDAPAAPSQSPSGR